MRPSNKMNAVHQAQPRAPILRNTPVVRRLRPVPSRPVILGRTDRLTPHVAAARGLTQMFGLDIRAAILTVIVDLMVFGGDVISLGLLIPLGIAVGGVLGFIVYKIQSHWYKDDHQSAVIKALIVGLLTAIPVPLGPVIAIPGGLLGIVNSLKRK
jgi:hypothetical protein